VLICSKLSTFWDNLSVPSSGVFCLTLEDGIEFVLKHSNLHSILEEQRSQKDTSLHRCLWSYSNLPMHAATAGVRSMCKIHYNNLLILTVMFQSHCFKNKIFYLLERMKNICMKYYYVTSLSAARGNCHTENCPMETGIECILLVSILFPKQNRWLPHNV
jgi:hypothetical protein